MLYLYDSAIVSDLRSSFVQHDGESPVVCVVPPEDIVSIAAQLQEDHIHFPMIAVSREDNVPVDKSLTNYTRLHSGVSTVVDPRANEIYQEKSLPLTLTYTLVCMSTNTADVDELVREILFKYASQYFLSIIIPYESKRRIRFGIRIDPEEEIERYTSTSNYLQEGKLYSAGIKLHIDGAVYVHYTPVKLRRVTYDTVPEIKPTTV